MDLSNTYRRNRFRRAAMTPVDASWLGVYRIVFGVVMAVYAFKDLANGTVRNHFVIPQVRFSYFGLDWLAPLPGGGMYLLYAGMGVLAICVALGIAVRWTGTGMALCYSYSFFCDRGFYLNHYYLIVLLCWLMVILPADRIWALSRIAEQKDDFQRTQVPEWTLWLVRFHIGIPYVYGGIAKLNSDWLAGQPMRMTLSTQSWFEPASQLVGESFLVALFSWGGLLFDLLVVPGLMWKRTRVIAFLCAAAFHITNSLVFPIGVFPWLMLAASTMFFEPDWPRRLWQCFEPGDNRAALQESLIDAVAENSPQISSTSAPLLPRWATGLLLAYFGFHLLFPLRHHLYEGNPSWTERGHHFAWHMMLRGKRCGLRLYATDVNTRQTVIIDLRQWLTAEQLPRVSRDPEHVRQLAHRIAGKIRSDSGRNVEIRAWLLVSLNGRKPQLLIDPAVDLASQPAYWKSPDWILPLTEPLLREHWDVPLEDWEKSLNLNPAEAIGLTPEQKQ